jgi:alpha-beta hydrolase superfamily lysophospholipase/tRNA-binding EMAP/Myf-like protein
MHNTNGIKHIIVVLHGYAQKPKKYESVKKVIAECYPDAAILLPALGMTTFSVADPDIIVAKVLKLIDGEYAKALSSNNGLFKDTKIIIVGHSTGAVLARKLYVAACGENPDAPFEKAYSENKDPRVWATQVDRIILFAGMNRGWTLNHHLYTSTAIMMRIGIFVGHLLHFFGYKPLAFKTRRGASFITQLRIQWLSMLRHAYEKKVGDILTIQLLGTIDDIISPEDNIDLITGGNFIYLEVPGSDHMNVLKMKDGVIGEKRKAIFEKALLSPPKELFEMQIIPADQGSIKVDTSITDVVFVIHGIRDTGYWTQKVAWRVKAAGDKAGRKFATETSTYGYFPMLPFLLSFVRRKKVEWLMDQYTENLAQYPNAEFSFMGHSNGTYLLAKAMKEYPACKFKNVVFAGSVVHSGFNWKELIEQKRISKFYNLVASSDWVVAMFPKTFQRLRIQDLGSGGFDGFKAELDEPYQLKFVSGSHGAATEEKYWDEIANIIVQGRFSESVHELSTIKRSAFMKILGAVSPLPFLLIIACLILGAWAILHFDYNVSENMKIIFFILYFLGIWKLVTKL